MWNVDPAVMCDKHLLGEHVEMHMFVGALSAGRSIRGHVDRGQVDVRLIQSRHDALAAEMQRRGMKHNSPLNYKVQDHVPIGPVDTQKSLHDLANRCDKCKKLQKNYTQGKAGLGRAMPGGAMRGMEYGGGANPSSSHSHKYNRGAERHGVAAAKPGGARQGEAWHGRFGAYSLEQRGV